MSFKISYTIQDLSRVESEKPSSTIISGWSNF